MLIQFNFGNFKSYKNLTSLDMTATSIKEHPENLISSKKDEKHLKSVAIYGSNSSGKSNIINAFEHMQFLVLTSFSEASKRTHIPLKRFQLDAKSKDMPSKFEVFFTIFDIEYQYGFELTSKEIKEEWLYKRDYRGKNKYSLIFERNNQKFELSEKMQPLKELLKSVTEQTLLLSFLANTANEDTKNVNKWFLETEVIDFGDPFWDALQTKILPSDCFKEDNSKEFKDFLKAIDVGIESIRVEEIFKNENKNNENPSYKAFSVHKNTDTNTYTELILSEESSGTLKMINLYSFLKTSLQKGLTLFVDELDAKLHPLLTRYIINLFNSENNNNAQLIFSTHDVTNLNKDIFRRDQIWFVEKNNDMSSNLFSLSEIKADGNSKIRNDASYNKDYLNGRYGAIPILSDFNTGGEE
ncbi:MAG: ATP-binding protein [Aliarcobacter sp.]|nr:ATP-binding protein [Aliarcobacter sp.]